MVVILGGIVGPARAEAQPHSGVYTGFFTPQIGITTGEDVSDAGFTAGMSMAVLDSEGWGAEIDLVHATSIGDAALDDSGLTSLMLNVIYIWRRTGVQPFGVAGAGALRLSHLQQPDGSTRTKTDLGLMMGGGVHVPLNEVFAFRADVRYLRYLSHHHSVPVDGVFGTWRFAAGVTINFPLQP
jgi:opacity protein-like surface antigen